MDVIIYRSISAKNILNFANHLSTLLGCKLTIEKKEEVAIAAPNKSLRFNDVHIPWIHEDAYAEWKDHDSVLFHVDDKRILSIKTLGNWTSDELQKIRIALESWMIPNEEFVNPGLIPLPPPISAIVVACLCNTVATEYFSPAELKAFKQMYFPKQIMYFYTLEFTSRSDNWKLCYKSWKVTINKDFISYTWYKDEVKINDSKNLMSYIWRGDNFKIYRNGFSIATTNPVPYLSPEIIQLFDRHGEFKLAQLFKPLIAKN